MCPKAKADQVITHRIELQQTERDALEMYVASNAAKNIMDGAGNLFSNLVTPLTTCTVWGAATAAMIIETILFSQDKGLVRGLFGVGEDIGSWTYGLKTDLQDNYNAAKKQNAQVRAEHQKETDERRAEFIKESYAVNYFWSPLRGGWVDPISGDVISTDRSIDPNAA